MDPSADNQFSPGIEQAGSPLADLSSEREWRKSRRRSSPKIGRVLVLVVFGLLVGTYVAAGHFVANHRDYYEITGFCYAAPLWISALTLGIWMKHRWAQYVLTALLVFSLLAAIAGVALLVVRDPRSPSDAVIGVVVYGVVQVVCAVILIRSRDVNRLTHNH